MPANCQIFLLVPSERARSSFVRDASIVLSTIIITYARDALVYTGVIKP